MEQHEPAPAEKPKTIFHHTYFCNRCPASAIVANMANETPERIELARNTCLACKGHRSDAPFWTDGQSWVHYDGAENGASFALTMADPMALPNNRKRTETISSASEAVENAVLSILRMFAAMSQSEVLEMHREKSCHKILSAIANSTREAEEAARKVSDILMELTKTQLLAMWGLMRGMSYVDTAREVGLSKQMIHKSALLAYAKYPALLSLAPTKRVFIRNIGKVKASLQRGYF